MQFLERLRSKQSHVKAQIAFAGAVTVTGLVALIWVSTLPAQFNKIGEQIVKEDESQTASAGSAFDDILGRATAGLDALDDELDTEEIVDPAPPIPTDSALNKLEGWWAENENATRTTASPAMSEQVPVVEPVISPTPEPIPPPNQSAEPVPQSPQPTPEPTPQPSAPDESGAPSNPSVILIGTTTKKTE